MYDFLLSKDLRPLGVERLAQACPKFFDWKVEMKVLFMDELSASLSCLEIPDLDIVMVAPV